MQERRRFTRHRVLKGGKIVFNRRYSAIDCTVRNLSDAGAMLTVAGQTAVPHEFDIEMEHAFVRHCRVVWRHDNRLGVQFAS